MRRTIPYAVAVVATVVAVLAVMGVPRISFGQSPVIHGGTPSEVFMQTDTGVCSDYGMAQDLTLAETSHLLVYFTGEWTGLGPNEAGYLWFRLDGTDTDFDWYFPGTNRPETTIGTVMWTFEDVGAGPHTVSVHSVVMLTQATPGGSHGEASAGLQSCALTVMVIPPAEQ